MEKTELLQTIVGLVVREPPQAGRVGQLMVAAPGGFASAQPSKEFPLLVGDDVDGALNGRKLA